MATPTPTLHFIPVGIPTEYKRVSGRDFKEPQTYGTMVTLFASLRVRCSLRLHARIFDSGKIRGIIILEKGHQNMAFFKFGDPNGI